MTLALMLLLSLEAAACNCIAREANPQVLMAYRVMTAILVLLPMGAMTWMARRLMHWDDGSPELTTQN